MGDYTVKECEICDRPFEPMQKVILIGVKPFDNHNNLAGWMCGNFHDDVQIVCESCYFKFWPNMIRE